ncbi:hypothetical protein HY478_01540 [Candidatus Uhrbacteria bacterium]|nr:hypothetical protein [Candidatus Uhrbacteria bacterium]
MKRHVEAGYAVIRAPWARSKTIRAESRFPDDTKIEGSMIRDIAARTLETDTEFERSKVMETSVVRVELNGYPTSRPEGKKAKRIAVCVLLSECNPTIAKGVPEIMSRVFACPPPTLRSGTRALLGVLGASNHLPKECFVVDMTSEGTSMLAVRKGIAAESASLSEGISSIVRRIAGGKMPEETLTMIRLLANDQCETESCEALSSAIAKTEPELVKMFGDAVGALAQARRLPNALILIAHDDLLPWLSHFFSRIDFAPFTITTRPFVPNALRIADLQSVISVERVPALDSNLAIAGALVNIERQSFT